MAKGENQKLKLLYLRDFLLETDAEHPLTMEEMLAMLKARQVDAERKSIYSDIEALRIYGMDIALKKLGRTAAYYLNTREYEVNDLKMLIDSVQSASFLTEKRAQKLIQKVSAQSSRYRSELIQRKLDHPFRDHSPNESLFRAIDTVYTAIAEDVQIRFRYWHYGMDKKPVYEQDGKAFHVSPFSVLFESGRYHMLAYDSRELCFRRFRLDRVSNLVVTHAGRTGKEEYSFYSLSEGAAESSPLYTVILQCDVSALDSVIDRYGRNITITDRRDETCAIEIKTSLSPLFFGWLAASAGHITVAAPSAVRNRYKAYLEDVLHSV
jgi:predicted DNA-binding transcriptional regulator YafY